MQEHGGGIMNGQPLTDEQLADAMRDMESPYLRMLLINLCGDSREAELIRKELASR